MTRAMRALTCVVVCAVLGRARADVEARAALGGGGIGDVAATRADAEATDRFGTMDEVTLRRIVNEDVDDDPDDAVWADVDAEDVVVVEEDGGGTAGDGRGGGRGGGRKMARLGSAAPTVKELRKMKRIREREMREGAAAEGTTEALGVDPEEALRRIRNALEREDEDGELGSTPVFATSNPMNVRRPPVDSGSSTRRAPPHRGFPSSVPGTMSSADSARQNDPARLRGWVLTFSDEFDGSTLDLSKWRPKMNSSAPGLERFGGQQQFYTPSMCKVVDGALVIATRRQDGVNEPASPHSGKVPRGDGANYPFLSCWVDTKEAFTQTYGRVEIRAKLPDSKCPGIWPQHWMLPDPEKSVPKHACWPLGGQIDIMQSYGRGRGGPGTRPGTVESGYHFAPKAECGAEGFARNAFPPMLEEPIDFSAEFHTYAVEWSKESLTFFVDGHPVQQLSRFNVPIIPRWPFYLILNTAVSPFGMPAALDECQGDFFHYVDYVRVYKRAAARLNPDVWRFLAFSGVVLVTFIAISVFTLRRAFARDGIEDYPMIDSDDDVDLLAVNDDLYVVHEDEFGAVRRPVKAFAYSLDDDDDGAPISRRAGVSASSPLLGNDVVLALPDDGTGRFRRNGPYIRRRANPPQSSRPGVFSDVWARDDA